MHKFVRKIGRLGSASTVMCGTQKVACMCARVCVCVCLDCVYGLCVWVVCLGCVYGLGV